jgi:hypothetical protein
MIYVESPETTKQLSRLIDDRFNDSYPGVIAVNGTWGSGKSCFLSHFEQGTRADLPKNDGQYIYINHNAWENNDFENPLLPILLSISEEIDKLSQPKKFLDSALEVALSLFAASLYASIEALGSIDPNCKIAWETTKNVFKIIKKIMLRYKAKKLSENPLFSSIKTYSDLYQGLQKAINDFSSKTQFRLILVIDDIDRCLPIRQIQLLESLHHISEGSRMLTILALNIDSVKSGVNFLYGKSDETKGYLEKILNGSIDLSRREVGTYYNGTCKSFFDKNKASFSQASLRQTAEQIYKGTWSAISNWSLMGQTMRRARKFECVLNHLTKNYDIGQVSQNPFDLALLAIWSAIFSSSKERFEEMIFKKETEINIDITFSEENKEKYLLKMLAEQVGSINVNSQNYGTIDNIYEHASAFDKMELVRKDDKEKVLAFIAIEETSFGVLSDSVNASTNETKI